MNFPEARALFLPEDAAASHNRLEELWQTSAGMDPQDTEDNRKVLGMGIVGYLLGELHSALGQKPVRGRAGRLHT